MEIMNEQEVLAIDSREAAEMVDKDHSKLMRDIRTYIGYLGEAKIGHSDYFIESTYITAQNKEQPCYLLTKLGCEMVSNKLTGRKGVVFTAKYVKKFNEMKQDIKQLTQDNKDLHTIAISDEDQEQRQYEADKVRYSIRNIKPLLNNCTYKNLEDTVNKIVEVHSNLKSKDRYVPHHGKTKTEYKQHVRKIITNALDEIYNTTLDGSLRTIALDVNNALLSDVIATNNRSKDRIIKNKTKINKELKQQLDNAVLYPRLSEFVTIGTHGFSNNYMYETRGKNTYKTPAYKEWIDNFPYDEVPCIDHWDDVDFDKPVELFLNYVTKETIDGQNRDHHNCDKSIIDMLFGRIYDVDDGIVHLVHSQFVGTCDTYADGKISFCIRNIEE